MQKQYKQAGFSAVEILIALVVVGATVALGYFAYSRITKSSQQADLSNQTNNQASDQKEQVEQNNGTDVELVDETAGWVRYSPQNTDNTYSIKVPKELEPASYCNGSKDIVFGLTYSSYQKEISCASPEQALGYGSVVFGVSSQNAHEQFLPSDSSETKKLANGQEVTRHVSTKTKKGNGGDYSVRYVLYTAKSNNGVPGTFYAVYETGVGFSDEDVHLKNFDYAVTKGWEIP